jgi:hypothetical protein
MEPPRRTRKQQPLQRLGNVFGGLIHSGGLVAFPVDGEWTNVNVSHF